MLKYRSIYVLICACILFTGCEPQSQVQISGNIDYTGSSKIFLSKQPIYYKYSKKIQFPVSPDENGDFNLTVPVDSSQIIESNIDGAEGRVLLKIPRGRQLLFQKIDDTLSAFRDGEETNLLSLDRERYQLARKRFQGTPPDDLYYHGIGEYLAKKLEKIKYRSTQAGFNPEEQCLKVLNEAKELDFFTFEHYTPSGREFGISPMLSLTPLVWLTA